MTRTDLNNRRCILIIDDEPSNLKLLDRMLRSQGFDNLVLIQDPREVLEKYQTHKPDLILLDINMPYLDGYQVLEQLKALEDPLLPPIVILTAQSSDEHLLKALSLGARDFITKPFDLNELLMRVRNMLDAQLAHRMVFDQKNVLDDLVKQRTEELCETRLQVVQCLGRAAEYRDNETGNHILRMSNASVIIARSLGWTEGECELMLHASPMHDIGKIGIPDNVLLKPGKLDPQEWEIMKTHVEIGGEILGEGDSELMQLAKTIAMTHHEKWDGSGYPYGLAGEDISQAGRIVALADVFDALTSVRPYKLAWTVGKAKAHIEEHTGKHFDPQIVPHFFDCLAEIIEMSDRYRDEEAMEFT